MQSPNKTPATGQHWLGRQSLSADLGSGLRLLRAEPRTAGGCHTARLGPEPSAALLQAGACHQRLVKGSGFRSPDRASSFPGLAIPALPGRPVPCWSVLRIYAERETSGLTWGDLALVTRGPGQGMQGADP